MIRAKKIRKAVGIVAGIIIVLWLIAPLIAVPIFINRHVNYRGYADEKYPMQDIYTAEEFGLEDQQRYLITEDGLKVWCSEVKVADPKAVIIYLSGIDQPSVTYFYGHSKWMKENGYATILLEVRGHGKSEGNQICFGYEETQDVQAVVDYIKGLKEYGGVPIVIQGVSMGGACAINAFGQIEEIDAVIAMSAYSSAEEVILDLEGQNNIPRALSWIQKPLVKVAFQLCFNREAVDEMRPIKQITNANGRPVFLIACSGDKNGVPAVSTQRLKDAYEGAQVWIRDSWEHFVVKDCDFYNVEEDTEYCDRILTFLEEVITIEHKN